MRTNLTKNRLGVNNGSGLSAFAFAALVSLSACNGEAPVEEQSSLGMVVSESSIQNHLKAEEASPSQPDLKEKLETEQKELMDMNQRKAELEAEILQIKQAINEADRAIEQKEQELQVIAAATDGESES